MLIFFLFSDICSTWLCLTNWHQNRHIENVLLLDELLLNFKMGYFQTSHHHFECIQCSNFQYVFILNISFSPKKEKYYLIGLMTWKQINIAVIACFFSMKLFFFFQKVQKKGNSHISKGKKEYLYKGKGVLDYLNTYDCL